MISLQVWTVGTKWRLLWGARQAFFVRPGSQRWGGGAPGIPPGGSAVGLAVPTTRWGSGKRGVCWDPAMLRDPRWQPLAQLCSVSNDLTPHPFLLLPVNINWQEGVLGCARCWAEAFFPGWSSAFISLAALAQAAACFPSKLATPRLRSRSLAGRPLAGHHGPQAMRSGADLVSPRASPAAQLLRDQAGLAGRLQPGDQPPQKSQGWLVERSGR